MNKYKQNLHTHSIYCDGKDAPEDMVLKAIDLGFDTLGFSGHSYMGFDISWHMSPENTEKYIKEIDSLKLKYSDKITILRGIELDVFAEYKPLDYDYIIGSLHFFKLDGKCVEFDCSADEAGEIINQYFGGDGMKYARAYYEHMAELYKYADFDIVGHYDIITKHCETRDYFDVNSKEYQNFALEALDALAEKKKIFEINTGAISRGYRTTPYPSPFILKRMKELGCTVILSSDCHNKDFLDCYYDDGIELVKSCGFDSIGVMKNGIICEEKI